MAAIWGLDYMAKDYRMHQERMQTDIEYRENYLKKEQAELEKRLEDARLWREKFEKHPWAYAGMR